jgi:hypothetical protein
MRDFSVLQNRGMLPFVLQHTWVGPHIGGTTQQISPSQLGGGFHQARFPSASFKLLHRQRFYHHI